MIQSESPLTNNNFITSEIVDIESLKLWYCHVASFHCVVLAADEDEAIRYAIIGMQNELKACHLVVTDEKFWHAHDLGDTNAARYVKTI